MIFSKDINRECRFCTHCTHEQTKDVFLCRGKKRVLPSDSCMWFKYDVLKREPKKPVYNPQYDKDDFNIE